MAKGTKLIASIFEGWHYSKDKIKKFWKSELAN